MTPKGETLPAIRTTGELASLDAMLDEFNQLLRTGEVPEAEVLTDPEQIGRDILEQILAARSEEELEQVSEATGWRELEGVPVEIHEWRYMPSRFDGEGPGVFVVVRAVRLDTGRQVILTTGSLNVMGQLSTLARTRSLPSTKMLVRKDTNTPGRSVLWLKTPDAIRESWGADTPGEQAAG